MAQRINISISDSLYERLQAVKDHLNVSGICQEAIMNAVYLEELKNKNIPDMEKLVERLRKQKEEAVKEYGEAGKVQGMEDAMTLDYADFVTIEKASEALNSTDGWALDPEELLGDSLAGQYSGLAELLNTLEQDDSSFDRRTYAQGWIGGVMEVWDRVKEEI